MPDLGNRGGMKVICLDAAFCGCIGFRLRRVWRVRSVFLDFENGTGFPQESPFPIMCSRSIPGEHDPASSDRPREAQDRVAKKADFQAAQRARGCEHVVVAVEPARLVDGDVLRSKDPASTQDTESARNSAGHARFRALRRLHPFGPTQPASEALGGTGKTGLCISPLNSWRQIRFA